MQLKKRKCRNRECRKEFIPDKPFQVVCSIDCAQTIAEQSRERARKRKARREAKELKDAKEKIKSRSEWIREAQSVFNLFIRARDRGRPCISCGRPLAKLHHAGHFKPTSSSPELRFDEQNVHSQCVQCNVFFHGNLVHYREGLIQRYGEEVIDYLEGPHEPKKWAIEELKEIKRKYKQKLKDLN